MIRADDNSNTIRFVQRRAAHQKRTEEREDRVIFFLSSAVVCAEPLCCITASFRFPSSSQNVHTTLPLEPHQSLGHVVSQCFRVALPSLLAALAILFLCGCAPPSLTSTFFLHFCVQASKDGPLHVSVAQSHRSNRGGKKKTNPKTVLWMLDANNTKHHHQRQSNVTRHDTAPNENNTNINNSKIRTWINAPRASHVRASPKKPTSTLTRNGRASAPPTASSGAEAPRAGSTWAVDGRCPLQAQTLR